MSGRQNNSILFADGINEATFLTNQSTDFSVLVNQCEFLQINVKFGTSTNGSLFATSDHWCQSSVNI